MWIFVISAAFQIARVLLWVPRGNQQANTEGVFGVFSQYRPYAGPDFWRWIEYALTSPLQIVIVASSFTVSDRSLLLALGTLQGALTLVGISIETELQEVCLQRIDDAKGVDKRRQKSHVLKVLVLLWSAWAIHGAIWFMLFERLARQKNNLYECGYEQRMPRVVDFIVFSQFMLFSVFGVVPCIQLGLLLTQVHRTADKNADPASWAWASRTYSVLSVTAKSLLFIGFLMLVETLPRP